jgi:hypothetical protein
MRSLGAQAALMSHWSAKWKKRWNKYSEIDSVKLKGR